jgi:hypothetical protein
LNRYLHEYIPVLACIIDCEQDNEYQSYQFTHIEEVDFLGNEIQVFVHFEFFLLVGQRFSLPELYVPVYNPFIEFFAQEVF